MMKARITEWTEFVARVGEMRKLYKIHVLINKCEDNRPLGRPKNRWNDITEIKCTLDSSCSNKCPVAGSCEHCNEHLGFHYKWKFLDQLSYCQLYKKDSASWSWI
jgi:hypothetical protein